MRINVQNMLRQVGHALPRRNTAAYPYVLKQLAEHLLQLRDRTQAGDLVALDEFFALYVFDDGRAYERQSPVTPARKRPACAGCGLDATDRCPYCQTLTCGKCKNCEHAHGEGHS